MNLSTIESTFKIVADSVTVDMREHGSDINPNMSFVAGQAVQTDTLCAYTMRLGRIYNQPPLLTLVFFVGMVVQTRSQDALASESQKNN